MNVREVEVALTAIDQEADRMYARLSEMVHQLECLTGESDVAYNAQRSLDDLAAAIRFMAQW